MVASHGGYLSEPETADFASSIPMTLIGTNGHHRVKMNTLKSARNTVVCVLTLQLVIIVLFALFVDYHSDADAKTSKDLLDNGHLNDTYPMFQDVHVMIFIGFGFLMTFLKKYGFSSTGITMLIAAIIIQWGLLCFGFFRMEDGKIHINIDSMINADVIAAAVLISFGALLGKVSPMQLVIMGVLETVFFCCNEYIGTHHLKAIDAGGSMYVHVFGAYFGLTVSLVLFKGVKMTKKDEELEGSTYTSDLLAMIGTIFLWLFWPSFNGALVSGDDRHRAIINTYLSLVGSCVATFCISALFSKNNKFEMVHIQNATLAGGVCIGTVADLMVQPYGALTIGTFAGILSTLGFQFVQRFLHKSIGLHDTCGVNNLHGMPGLASGLLGALMAALAEEDVYGLSLYSTFSARSPVNNTMAYQNLTSKIDVLPGEGRTAALQAGYQLLALVMSFCVAVVGGLITGKLMKLDFMPVGLYHDDDVLWQLDYESGLTKDNLALPELTNGAVANPQPETTTVVLHNTSSVDADDKVK